MIELGYMLIGAGVVLFYIGHNEKKNREFTRGLCEEVKKELKELPVELERLGVENSKMYIEFKESYGGK